ncbi:MAG: hypothetical protein R3284_02600 [Rubricoccaceae bacterium]|nr:hypothetical protein [Rubricoccaceae bacterium]
MRSTIILATLALLFSACDTATTANESLRLSFSSIDPLANGFHYEGWAIINGEPFSTGKFNVDASGDLIQLDGTPIPNGTFNTSRDLSLASAIVITIEPDGDTDTSPSTTKFMGGDLSGQSASLATGHGSSLGDDFSSADGVYVLATPTDGSGTNENSGIWFLDLSSGSPAPGLTLPDLPDGWKYEGWSVINGTPVTTGTFTSVTGADEAAPFSGPQPGPPFPGEDFLTNAPPGLTFPTDLAGGMAVLSIEPFPDDDPAPFTLKPLVAQIPTDATDHTVYGLGNNASAFPTGTAIVD